MNPEPRRKPMRWHQLNYATPGAYAVTLCVHGGRHVFGSVRDGHMFTNAAGAMVWDVWFRMVQTFPFVMLDTTVVMPNHMHGILRLMRSPDGSVAPRTLGQVLAWFKSQTSLAYRRGVEDHGWTDMPQGLWQRGYWDRFLRNEQEFFHARIYFAWNPARWHLRAEHLYRRRS